MKGIFTAFWLLCSVNVFSQTTYFVNDIASGAGNGSSWTDAFTKLQDALSAVVSGDQIWVAAGIYYPDEGAGLTNNNRAHSFHLENGVAIYGGFAGTETLLSERNFSSNVTILSGDIDQNDKASNGSNANNSLHVVQSTSVDNTAILDGFTITGGNANVSPDNFGGGIYNNGPSPTLTASPTLTNCHFSANTADAGGGIANIQFSSPTLTNCSFLANTAFQGGGILNTGISSLKLTNCSFSANTASFNGGGIANIQFSSPTLTNCNFSANIAGTNGGGIYNDHFSSPTLTNCSFLANTAGSNGGGLYNFRSSFSTLTNCILWGNINGQIVDRLGSSSTVAYSTVQGGFPGTGNLDQDPLFVNAANGDLHLQAGSPAIDAGLNSANTTLVDLDGNPRIVNRIIDMGAIEFQGEALIVSSFTLINAETDQDIRELRDGDVINLATLPTTKLNIRANTNPSVVGSVVFSLSGEQTRKHTENAAPYALFSNNKEDYFAMTPKNGAYTLTATPYSVARGGGEQGTPLTIHFQVIYQVVNSFTLINADTDEDIRELKNGDVINLASLPAGTKLNIRANTTPATVGSVVFEVSGRLRFKHTENKVPYALLSNNKGDYFGITPPVGDYTLTATTYSAARGSGQKGATNTITFKVVNTLPVTSITERTEGSQLMEISKRFVVSVAPNPFNTTTQLHYELPHDGEVSIKLFDVVGREVATLVQAERKAGLYNTDLSAANLAKGVYYYRAQLTTKQKVYSQTGKIMVVK